MLSSSIKNGIRSFFYVFFIFWVFLVHFRWFIYTFCCCCCCIWFLFVFVSVTNTYTYVIHTHTQLCTRIQMDFMLENEEKQSTVCRVGEVFFTIFLPNFDRSHEFSENFSAELDWLTVSQHFNAIISNLSPKISIDMAQNRHDHDVLCTKSISRLKRRIFTHDIWKSLFQWVCLYVFVYENGY